ncbi:hypothetical protein [Orenia marismortui]|uniref:Carboxypeptidase family protein n=1 Tax=Orenia marismortui TaxID=46469 RepID=A0A4R8H312_9FIRM|nr:hypothetical protein [Orenia marismortui]TDX49058.1 hypothetical protein C7959_12111 [Orenia marismortui]
MKRDSLIVIVILILGIILVGCSDDSSNISEKLILSNLKVIDAETLEAEFNDGSKIEITDFTPKPLLEAQEIEVSFLYNKIEYKANVIYGATIFSGNVNMNSKLNSNNMAMSTGVLTTATDVSIMAVDELGNVYSTDTDSNGNFELLTVPDAPYVIIFMNSAGQYIGILKDNNEDTVKITASNQRIDLGEISIDEVAQRAISENVKSLNNVETSSIEDPDSITYTSDVNSINSMLFLPSTSNIAQVLGKELILGKVDYSLELNKPIFIEASFKYTVDTPVSADDLILNRVDYFYYKDNSKYLWKYKDDEDGNGAFEESEIHNPNDVVMPALMERNKEYTADVYGDDWIYNFEEIIDTLPNDNSINEKEIMVLKLTMPSGDIRYSYFAKGIGFVAFKNTEGTFDQVDYARAGKEVYGINPDWFTTELEENLRSKF